MQINSTRAKSALALAVLGLSVSLMAAPAAALTKRNSTYQNMGGNCHTADPIDEISGGQGAGWFSSGSGMLRAPLGYRNINDNNANFNDNITVICNFAANGYAAFTSNGLIRSVQLYARNTFTNRDVTLSCTITAGYATSSSNFSHTKSVLLTKNGVQGNIRWRNIEDNGGNYFPAPANVVCSVPAGVELNDAEITYENDVGS